MVDVVKTRYRTTIAFIAIWAFVLTIGAYLIIQVQSVLNAGAAILDCTTAQLNMLYPAMMAVAAAVAICQGPFTDRVGAEKVMLLALMLTAGAALVMAAAGTLSYAVVAVSYCLLLGAGTGLATPALLKELMVWFPKKGVGNAFGVVISVGGLLSWCVVNLILVTVFTANGGDAAAWWWPWALMLVFDLVFIPLWYWLTSRSHPAEVPSQSAATEKTRLYHDRGLWLWGVIGVAIEAEYVILLTYLPPYITAVAGFADSDIIWFMLTLMCLGGPLMGMGGALSDKLGGLKYIRIVLLLGLAILIPAFFAPTGFWSMFVLMLILAPGGMMGYAAFYRVIPEMGIDKEQIATAAGIVIGVQFLAAAFLTMLIGMLLGTQDPRTATTVAFVLVALLSLAALALTKVVARWITEPLANGP